MQGYRTKFVKCCASLDADGMVRIHAQNTEGSIVKGCPKDSRMAFYVTRSCFSAIRGAKKKRDQNVHSPPAVVWMCTVEKVPDDLQTLFVFKTHTCHVGADDETGNKEHGPAIFAGPMAVVGLEVFVECVPIPSSL